MKNSVIIVSGGMDSITLLYNSSTAGGNKGEMSRFMLQTLADASDLFAPQQVISLQALTSDSYSYSSFLFIQFI